MNQTKFTFLTICLALQSASLQANDYSKDTGAIYSERSLLPDSLRVAVIPLNGSLTGWRVAIKYAPTDAGIVLAPTFATSSRPPSVQYADGTSSPLINQERGIVEFDSSKITAPAQLTFYIKDFEAYADAFSPRTVVDLLSRYGYVTTNRNEVKSPSGPHPGTFQVKFCWKSQVLASGSCERIETPNENDQVVVLQIEPNAMRKCQGDKLEYFNLTISNLYDSKLYRTDFQTTVNIAWESVIQGITDSVPKLGSVPGDHRLIDISTGASALQSIKRNIQEKSKLIVEKRANQTSLDDQTVNLLVETALKMLLDTRQSIRDDSKQLNFWFLTTNGVIGPIYGTVSSVKDQFQKESERQESNATQRSLSTESSGSAGIGVGDIGISGSSSSSFATNYAGSASTSLHDMNNIVKALEGQIPIAVMDLHHTGSLQEAQVSAIQTQTGSFEYARRKVTWQLGLSGAMFTPETPHLLIEVGPKFEYATLMGQWAYALGNIYVSVIDKTGKILDQRTQNRAWFGTKNIGRDGTLNEITFAQTLRVPVFLLEPESRFSVRVSVQMFYGENTGYPDQVLSETITQEKEFYLDSNWLDKPLVSKFEGLFTTQKFGRNGGAPDPKFLAFHSGSLPFRIRLVKGSADQPVRPQLSASRND